MEIGLTLPTMVPGIDRDTVLEWSRRIDEGPFSTLAVGERISYPNPEMFVTLAAAAAVTERVGLMSTVAILPMHPAVEVAKVAATIDLLSGGRFTLGVGIGGREEDYRCLGAPFERRHARLDEQVAEMKRMWAGEAPYEGAAPVGPTPVQPGGPPLLAGAIGPKAVARAARWADGIAGFLLDPLDAGVGEGLRDIEAAWKEAGREDRPRQVTSFWYSLGDGSEDRLREYVLRYLGIFGYEEASAMAGICTAHGEDAVRAALQNLEEAGFDEVVLVPTTDDLADVDRLVEAASP